jgi:hypothetical protein
MTALGREGEAGIVSSLLDAASRRHLERRRRLVRHLRLRQRGRDDVAERRFWPATACSWSVRTRLRRNTRRRRRSPAIVAVAVATSAARSTEKGFKVLDPHVRVLWGDGIDAERHREDRQRARSWPDSAPRTSCSAWAAACCRSSTATRSASRSSRARRSATASGSTCSRSRSTPQGVEEGPLGARQGVFEDGRLLVNQTFDEIRERAAL